MGCAVSPAGRWRVTRQVALRIRYPKPRRPQPPPRNWFCEMGLSPLPEASLRLLCCSTIAEIRAKFDHFGPQIGRWVRNGPFPFKNDLFLVYSTIAESRAKFDHLGPQKHPVKAPSEENQRLEPPPNPNWHPSGLDRSSLQTQIQLFKIGSNQLGKKTNGLAIPNPNWHPSALDKSSLQTQIQC